MMRIAGIILSLLICLAVILSGCSTPRCLDESATIHREVLSRLASPRAFTDALSLMTAKAVQDLKVYEYGEAITNGFGLFVSNSIVGLNEGGLSGDVSETEDKLWTLYSLLRMNERLLLSDETDCKKLTLVFSKALPDLLSLATNRGSDCRYVAMMCLQSGYNSGRILTIDKSRTKQAIYNFAKSADSQDLDDVLCVMWVASNSDIMFTKDICNIRDYYARFDAYYSNLRLGDFARSKRSWSRLIMFRDIITAPSRDLPSRKRAWFGDCVQRRRECAQSWLNGKEYPLFGDKRDSNKSEVATFLVWSSVFPPP